MVMINIHMSIYIRIFNHKYINLVKQIMLIMIYLKMKNPFLIVYIHGNLVSGNDNSAVELTPS